MAGRPSWADLNRKAPPIMEAVDDELEKLPYKVIGARGIRLGQQNLEVSQEILQELRAIRKLLAAAIEAKPPEV